MRFGKRDKRANRSRHFLWIVSLAGLLCLSLGCRSASTDSPSEEETAGSDQSASNQQPSASIVDRLPANLRADFLRELPPMTTYEVASEDGAVKLRVEAEAAPSLVKHEEGHYALRTSILNGDIACYTYRERLDLAAVVHQLARETLELTKADWWGVDRIGAGAVQGRPYLHTTVMMRLDQGGKQTVGNFHVAAGAARDLTFACFSNPPGLRETFLRIFEGGLGSVSTPEAENPQNLIFHEVTTTTTQGAPIAFISDVFVYDETDAETHVVRFESSLARTLDLHLVADDEIQSEHSTQGRVFAGRYVGGSLDAIDHDLDLALVKGSDEEYEVTGTLMDKAFRARFSVSGGLRDERADTNVLARFIKNTSVQTIELSEYVPTLNPTGLVPAELTKRPKGSEAFNCTVTLGSLEFPANIDANGRMRSAKITMSGIEIDQRVVWSTGSLAGK